MSFETVFVCCSQEDNTQLPAVNKAESQYHSIKRREVDAPPNILKKGVSLYKNCSNKGGKSQSSSRVSSCMLIDALSYAILNDLIEAVEKKYWSMATTLKDCQNS